MSARRCPGLITWYMAPGYSTRNVRGMGPSLRDFGCQGQVKNEPWLMNIKERSETQAGGVALADRGGGPDPRRGGALEAGDGADWAKRLFKISYRTL